MAPSFSLLGCVVVCMFDCSSRRVGNAATRTAPLASLSVSLANGGKPMNLLGDAHRQSFDQIPTDDDLSRSRLSLLSAWIPNTI